MNYSTRLLFIGLIATLGPFASSARELSASKQNLSDAYLSQWFDVDSAEPINIVIKPLASDSIGERATVNFDSDDGQSVNGLIGYPSEEHALTKTAFVLHPMGTGQQFWWSDKSPLSANKITEKLRKLGYVVISLDARRHGERTIEGFGPRELLQRAHSEEPRLYTDTIIGTVRDYRTILKWSRAKFKPESTLVVGYSMGAQMSLLLASYEPSIDSVLAMVPPYVGNAESPVAPRAHGHKISDANVLWLAGREDPYSTIKQTTETFNTLATARKRFVWFDSGHRLPASYQVAALNFFDSLQLESE